MSATNLLIIGIVIDSMAMLLISLTNSRRGAVAGIVFAIVALVIMFTVLAMIL